MKEVSIHAHPRKIWYHRNHRLKKVRGGFNVSRRGRTKFILEKTWQGKHFGAYILRRSRLQSKDDCLKFALVMVLEYRKLIQCARTSFYRHIICRKDFRMPLAHLLRPFMRKQNLSIFLRKFTHADSETLLKLLAYRVMRTTGIHLKKVVRRKRTFPMLSIQQLPDILRSDPSIDPFNFACSLGVTLGEFYSSCLRERVDSIDVLENCLAKRRLLAADMNTYMKELLAIEKHGSVTALLSCLPRRHLIMTGVKRYAQVEGAAGYTRNFDQKVRKCVAKGGPVLGMVQETDEKGQMDLKSRGGLWRKARAGIKEGHAMIIVGYGRKIHGLKIKGLPESRNFFLMQNSWGRKNGPYKNGLVISGSCSLDIVLVPCLSGFLGKSR